MRWIKEIPQAEQLRNEIRRCARPAKLRFTSPDGQRLLKTD
jgi:hypothetical protein